MGGSWTDKRGGDKMENAILTEAGAKRIDYPKLAGQVVQYDEISHSGCAKNVYYHGKRICSMLSMTDKEDTGLAMVEFLYHWSRLHPRRKVHLSKDSKRALCGRDVSRVEVEAARALPPQLFLIQTDCALISLKPICAQCYRRAQRMEAANLS